MATEQKRYYWLKLSDDFFKQKEIKKLRSIAGGDTFTIIYLKMLLRSMKDGGKLYYEGIEDNFASELALDIDEEEDNVAVTVQFLLSKGILQQNTISEYEVITADEMTGSECDSARRMRKSRRIKRLSQASDGLIPSQCDSAVTESDIDIKRKNKDTPIAPKGGDADLSGFDQFWALYPNKKVKSTAKKAWEKLNPDDSLLRVILKDIERRMNGDWQGIIKKYIPHPATYLNQRRWEDEDDDGITRQYESRRPNYFNSVEEYVQSERETDEILREMRIREGLVKHDGARGIGAQRIGGNVTVADSSAESG